jgi:hypothetical protein
MEARKTRSIKRREQYGSSGFITYRSLMKVEIKKTPMYYEKASINKSSHNFKKISLRRHTTP